MADETQAPAPVVNDGSDATLSLVINSLKQGVADAATRNNAQVTAFTVVVNKWISQVTTLQAALTEAQAGAQPVHEDHTAQIADLLSSLQTVQSIGLADLPDSLKPPQDGVPPAALPPLVEPTPPTDVHVSESQGVVVSSTPPADAISTNPPPADTTNQTGAEPSDPGQLVVQPPLPEHQAPTEDAPPATDAPPAPAPELPTDGSQDPPTNG